MAVPDGFMQDAAGRYVPATLVKPEHLLQDGVVRRLHELADAQEAALSSLKATAFAEFEALLKLLAEKYGVELGGAGGNTTFTSYDGSLRVQVAVGKLLDFGPELQVAKALIDKCLMRWTQGGNDNVRAIITDAFDVGKEGKLQVDRILSLRRLAIDDAEWLRAMEAIGAAVQVVQSKRYVRFYRRETPASPYVKVALDLSSAM